MKKNKLLFWIFSSMLILISVVSCVTDEVIFNNSDINNLTFNEDVYENLKINSETEISSTILYNRVKKRFESSNSISSFREDPVAFESLVISSSILNLENLNEIFNEESTNVIGLTLFKEVDNGLVSGIAIHHQQINEDGVKLFVYNRISDLSFDRIMLDAKKVGEFTYDQLFYISKEYFPGKNMETLVVSDINDYSDEERIDDFAILEIVSRLGGNNSYRDFDVSTGIDEFIDDGSGGNPCGLVPSCWNGGANTYCAPFANGCRVRGSCSRISVSERFIDSNMNSENSEFESILPTELLYNLKDTLNTYKVGQFLIESYYSVSKQFKETLDAELLLKILVTSPELKELVDAFLEDDENYFLSEANYLALVGVIDLSMSKSSNKVYKDFMSELLVNLEMFKGKSINQIKTLLIPIE